MAKRLIVRILWLFALAATALPAHAAQLGSYVGGAYGLTNKDLDLNLLDVAALNIYSSIQFTPYTHNSELDTEGQGYTGMLGYRLSRHLALEGMFVHLGDYSYRTVNEGAFASGPATVTTTFDGEATGIGLYALGVWPFSYRWELYARGGIQFTSSRIKLRATDGTGQLLGENRQSATDYAAGVGIAMSMLEIYGARLEYMRVFDAGVSATGEGDVDIVSLGFIVAF